jgi:hypothetical protein
MKTATCLFFLAVSTFLAADTEAVSLRSTSSVSNSRSYKRIDHLISTIEHDVKKDISSLATRMDKDKKVHDSYAKKLDSYTTSIRTFKRHMERARAAYLRFSRLAHVKSTEAAHLLASLQRQRVFIRQERRYINHMEREALRLKKYSSRYVAIRKEIREMRVQVNKEIADVERAYRLAHRHLLGQKVDAINKRDKSKSHQLTYSHSMAKFQSLYQTYAKLIAKLHHQGLADTRLMKELTGQVDLLEEIKVILSTFKPGSGSGNGSDRYKSKYESCVSDFHLFRNRYANMNCTAL